MAVSSFHRRSPMGCVVVLLFAAALTLHCRLAVGQSSYSCASCRATNGTGSSASPYFLSNSCLLTSGSCLDTLYKVNNRYAENAGVCNANDVDVSSLTSATPGNTFCLPGQEIDVNLIAKVVTNGRNRYDIGFVINPSAGSSAQTGSRCVGIQFPKSCSSGTCSSFNSDADDDCCGDWISSDSSGSTVFVRFPSLRVVCQTNGSAGATAAVLDYCGIWDNNFGGSCKGLNTTSLSSGEALAPGTRSKCRCEKVDITKIFVVSMNVTKEATPRLVTRAGQTITYTVLLSNTANYALTNLVVTDTLSRPVGTIIANMGSPSGDNAPTGALNRNETWKYTYTYTVTQADVDAGGVLTNVVRAVSTEIPAGVTDTANVTVNGTSALSVVKRASVDSVAAVGTVVTYTVSVKNVGTKTLSNIQLQDDTFTNRTTWRTLTTYTSDSSVAGTKSDLLLSPDETWIYTYTYTIKQSDIDSGKSLVNNVRATSTQTATYENSQATVTVSQTKRVSLVKTANKNNVGVAGTVVTYTYTVSNTGTVTLTNVVLTDYGFKNTAEDDQFPVRNPGVDTGNDAKLSPGETWTYTLTYTVTQADLDKGPGTVFKNLATVTTAESATATDDETITMTAVPGLTFTKTADPTVATSKNDVITYTYVLTNTGGVTLTGVTVVDDNATPGPTQAGDDFALTQFTSSKNSNAQLELNEVWTYTSTYQITQADIDDNRVITNIATVTTAQGVTQTSQATVTASGVPAVNIDKDAHVEEVATANAMITYTVTVTNAGNKTLTNVIITDTGFDGTTSTLGAGSKVATSDPVNPGKLDVGEAWVYIYTVGPVGQDLFDNGSDLVNTVSVTSAQTPTAKTVSATVTIVQSKRMEVTKTADVGTVDANGDIISYTYTVENTGTVSLAGVVLTDDSFTSQDPNDDLNPILLSSSLGRPVTAASKLKPGEIWTYMLNATVNQEEVDAGTDLTNKVYATSTTTGDDKFTAEETVEVEAIKTWKLTKTTPTIQVEAANEVVTYTLVLNNTGTATISGVTLTDYGWSVSDATDDTVLTTFTSNLATDKFPDKLEVGEWWTYTMTATVSQDNIDANKNLVNRAVASSTTPGFDDVQDSVSVSVKYDPKISVEKEADVNSVNEAGDIIPYKFYVGNPGNVALTGISVEDKFDGASTSISAEYVSGDLDNNDKLGPGETWVYKIDYSVTQDDIDAKMDLGNVVTVDSAESAPATDSLQVEVKYEPSIDVAKSADLEEVTAAGDVVTYTITVINNGKVTLTDVKVVDNNFTRDDPADDFDLNPAFFKESSSPLGTPAATLAKLSPGEAWTFEYKYTVTQDDMDRGSLSNSVTASSKESEPASDDKDVTVVQDPQISLLKTSSTPQVTQALEVITYTLTVKNEGTVTLKGVSISDDNGTPNVTSDDHIFTKAGVDLAPKAVWTFTYDHEVTQDDMDDLDKITNTATVTTGNYPDLTAEAFAEVTILGDLNLVVRKTASPSTVTRADDVITYTLTLENKGTITIKNVVISDDGGTPGSTPALTADDPDFTTMAFTSTKNQNNLLEVGEIWTYTYTYTVKQGNIDDGGKIINKVKVTSNDDEQQAEAEVITDGSAGVQVDKTADPAQISKPGNVTYTIVVINTGSKTLTALAVRDDMGTPATSGDDMTDTIPTLNVGSNYTKTYQLAVTQEMIDAGRNIINTVTVIGALASDTDSELLTVVQDPRMVATKTADKTVVSRAGDVVTFYIDVENTGYVSIDIAAVKDNAPLGDGLPLTPAAAGDKNNDGKISPGEKWRYTYVYTVTQPDIDANVTLVNTATVTTTKPALFPTQTPSVEVSVQGTAIMSVTKTATLSQVTTSGTIITYTVTVENKGTVTLPGVTVTDNYGTPAPLTADDMNLITNTLVKWSSSVSIADTTLDVGEVWTFLYDYTVSDTVLYGSSNLVNLVTATSTKTSPVSASVSVNLLPPQGVCSAPALRGVTGGRCVKESCRNEKEKDEKNKSCTKCVGSSNCCLEPPSLRGQCASSAATNCPDGLKAICNGGGNKGQGNCGPTVFCKYDANCQSKRTEKSSKYSCWGVTFCKFANQTVSDRACPPDVPSGAFCFEDGFSSGSDDRDSKERKSSSSSSSKKSDDDEYYTKMGDNFKVCCNKLVNVTTTTTTGPRRLFGFV